jgi:hypothetical protein
MVGLILSGLHVIAANLAAENFRDVVYYGRGSNNLLQKVQNRIVSKMLATLLIVVGRAQFSELIWSSAMRFRNRLDVSCSTDVMQEEYVRECGYTF